MKETYYPGGVLRQRWDDTTSTYTEYDASGAVTLSRAYNAQETADAQARATADTRASNLATIFTQAQNAIATNTTFLGLASPTNAQVVSEVQALARQSNKVIRLLISEIKGDQSALDSTN